MVAFGHTAVGVIVGVTVHNFLGQYPEAFGLAATGAMGVVSHYLMDAIPHGHFFASSTYKKVIVPIIIFDLLLSIALFLGAFYLKNGFDERLMYVLFGIGGSHLPDVIGGLVYTRIIKPQGLLKIENNLHEGIHKTTKESTLHALGLKDLWQLSVILFAWFLIW